MFNLGKFDHCSTRENYPRRRSIDIRAFVLFVSSLALIFSSSGCSGQASEDLRASEQANLAAGEKAVVDENYDSALRPAFSGDVSPDQQDDPGFGTLSGDASEMAVGLESAENTFLDDLLGEFPMDSLEYSTGRVESELEYSEDALEPVELAIGASLECEEIIDPGRNALVAGPVIPGQQSNDELLPQGWPEYIPIMDGFTILYTAMDKTGMKIIASSELSAGEVTDFYEQLEGWHVERIDSGSDSDENGSVNIVFNLSRNGEFLEVSVFIEQDTLILQLFYTGA